MELLKKKSLKEISDFFKKTFEQISVFKYDTSDKQDEIDFICDKTDEIVESISNFIKTEIQF